MGCVSPGHAVRAVAILHRLPQTGRAVRRLGCGLPAVAHQPECTHQTRPARHGAAICSGRPSALRAHHHALLRCAHPAFARHAQGSQRGFGPPRLGEDRRGQRPALAAKPPGLLHRAAAERAVGARHGQHGKDPLRASGRGGGRLQSAKRGPPSHAYHTDMLSSLRLVLRVDVLPGDQYNVAHATDGLWTLLDHRGPTRRPALLRGDKSWGIERVMARAEQSDLAYLFRLRMTANVRRSLERAMQHADWVDAGQGWQGKETSLRLAGWSRQRRIILLRRKLARDVAIADTTNGAQPRLGFAEIGPDQ